MNGLRKMASITKKIESVLDTPVPRDRSERITASTFGPVGALAGGLGALALAVPLSKTKTFKYDKTGKRVGKHKALTMAAMPLAAAGIPIGAAIGSTIGSGLIRSRRKSLEDTPEEQEMKNKAIYSRRGAPMPRKGRVLGY